MIKDALVSIQDVSLEYTGKTSSVLAIKDISMEIYEGDFVVLMGPSGCGKTTLLNVIAGYNAPTNGQVLLRSKPIEGAGKERGVIFQRTNLYPWLNVRENILFGPKLSAYDKEEIEKRYDHLMDVIGLEDYQKSYPFELSGGMQQRVAIARTLIQKPDILLMDEPFGALDAVNRSSLQTFMRDLWQKENLTVFMVTHDIDEALLLANRILVMSQGPGQIIKTLELDFSKKILQDSSYIPELDPTFMITKREILEAL
ncbi:MAG: ABC transporter ATP-binding protein [Ruminococcaceae bacterium]|nr:ABC transporter ATP-binding protein [Oscillospiraceae bacterium]